MSSAAARPRVRAEIDEAHKWDLSDIYPDWSSWDGSRKELEALIGEYAALKGTLASGANRLLMSFRLNDQLGQLAYKVYFFPSLKYDEDQRDNDVNARKQQVQALMARWQEATSWFSPELLTIPLETVEIAAPDYQALERPLQFTSAAAAKVRELIVEEGNAELKLRVYIHGGGCSGFQYGFEFDEQQGEDDLAVQTDGVTLLVDPLSLQYLMGAEVDYTESLHGAQFVIRNPNAKTTCGCGSSFSA